jgi:hypothetical protein
MITFLIPLWFHCQALDFFLRLSHPSIRPEVSHLEWIPLRGLGQRLYGESEPPELATETIGSLAGSPRGNCEAPLGFPPGLPPKTPRKREQFSGCRQM